MTDTSDIAVGDLVEVLFAYLGPDGKPEPGGARRRWRGHAVEVKDRLVLEVRDGEAPAPHGAFVLPLGLPGVVSVRLVRAETTGSRHPAGPAPAHLVGQVSAIAPRPMHPMDEPTVEQWQAHLQLVADRIWAEAWHAGAVWGQSIAAVPGMLVVTPEERDRLVERQLADGGRRGVSLDQIHRARGMVAKLYGEHPARAGIPSAAEEPA